MPRPSGMCNGVPCFTAQDRADIQAEIVDLQAQNAVDVPVRDALSVAITGRQTLITTKQMEMNNAIMQACP